MNVYRNVENVSLIAGPILLLGPDEKFTGHIGPNDVTLKTMFLYPHWLVRG